MDNKINFLVYGVLDKRSIYWKLSADIEVDLAYWQGQGYKNLLIVLSTTTIGKAFSLIKCLETEKRLFKNIFPANLENNLLNCLKKIEIKQTPFLKATVPGLQNLLSEYNTKKKLYISQFEGKILLFEEIFNYLSRFENNQININEIAKYLQMGYLLGDINISSGVSYPKKNESKLKCHRCGTMDKIFIRPCAICNDNCATCEACIEMGRSKTCTPLFIFSVINKKLKLPPEQLIPLELTEYQKNIAVKATEFINNNEKNEMLIWAVTGSGKTEMIFPAVNTAIAKGNRVLIASPRKDVIKELYPRFKKAFPNLQIIALYGGSNNKWETGDLYLATTHQVIRYNNFFDLIIIDEIDAFPYHNNPKLHFFINRALKKDGKMIYLTATPASDWKKKLKQNKIAYAILPVRYHKHPLPVPSIKIIPNKNKILFQKKPLPEIVEFIKKVNETNGQGFIFVAKVSEIPVWTNKLKTWFYQEKIDGVHASDPKRDDKITLFREGEIRFLVTTTIMERGVTIPNSHVLVIGAEEKIFDESTLVQIAGRVGRAKDFPNGLVWLLAEYKTNEIVKARKHIEKMNRFIK